jgi:hypothetical protein
MGFAEVEREREAPKKKQKIVCFVKVAFDEQVY